METFEIHFKMINNWGKKRPFVSKKIYSVTGWEAAEKTRKFINENINGIESVELDYWRVLNPFEAHFLDQSDFANQKREK